MKISVVTITRNDGPLLARTISSIYAQKLPPGVELEHIIVDGCSDTPETEAILAEAELAAAGLYAENRAAATTPSTKVSKHAQAT